MKPTRQYASIDWLRKGFGVPQSDQSVMFSLSHFDRHAFFMVGSDVRCCGAIDTMHRRKIPITRDRMTQSIKSDDDHYFHRYIKCYELVNSYKLVNGCDRSIMAFVMGQ